ncbi:hypothetical protein MMC30_007459 [Trapelia coarctata]|nr:hypothetical protein [Trapelia coarctata]
MSGVEVLGALASAAQVAFYVIQTNSLIIEQFKRLRNATTKFQQHADTATQLISIARVILSNQWLQTENMAALLEVILGRAEEVHNLLPKVYKNETAARSGIVATYWKAFRSLRKEERILAIFAGLEEQKSALALCILEIQTKLSGEMSCNVTKLLPMVDSIQEDVSHIRRGTGDSSVCGFCLCSLWLSSWFGSCARDFVADRLAKATTSSNHSIVTASTTTTLAPTPTSSTLTFSTSPPSPINRELTLVESPTTIGPQSFPSRPSVPGPETRHLGCTYENPLANDDATQINGDISIGAPSSARVQAHLYVRPVAAGSSVQMNGNVVGGDLGVLRALLGRGG